MDYQIIQFDKINPYYLITFNRLRKRNSLNKNMLCEINSALDEIEKDSTINMVIFQGQGGYFCTGMDLTVVETHSDEVAILFMQLLDRLSLMPRIIISLVEGWVMAGGIGFIAVSDLVYASQASQFSLPEAIWGLLPACVAPFLIRRIGFQATLRLTLTTKSIDTTEAKLIQLIDTVSETPLLKTIRPTILRLSRIDIRTIGEIKQYYSELWSISEKTKTRAVNKITDLVNTPWIRQKIKSSLTVAQSTGGNAMLNEEKAWTALKTAIKEILPDINDSMLEKSKSLNDLGANSVDRAEIIIATLACLQLRMPLAHFAEANSMQDLVFLLAKELPE